MTQAPRPVTPLADPGSPNTRDRQLLTAAMMGDATRAARALAKGAAPFCLNAAKQSPLHLAILADNLPCVRLLIQAGSPLEEPEPIGAGSLLLRAISLRHEDCAIALLEAGANPNPPIKALHTHAFYYAIVEGQTRLAEALIQADPGLFSSEPPPGSLSAACYLHMACDYARPGILSLILKAGVPPNMAWGDNLKPSLVTLLNNSLTFDEPISYCARLLVGAGADVNQIFDHGNFIRTPLMLATESYMPMTANALLDLGADWRIKDASGMSALSLAKSYKILDIHALIKARATSDQERAALAAVLDAPAKASCARPRV